MDVSTGSGHSHQVEHAEDAARAADGERIAVAVRSIQSGVAVEASYQWLFERFYRPLRSFFARRVKGAATEETVHDLIQRTWLRVHNGIDGFGGRSLFSTWLFRIAFNTGASWQRAEGSRGRPDREYLAGRLDGRDEEETSTVTAVSDASSPLEEAIDEELVDRLYSAIRGLPSQMQRCMLLRVHRDLSYQEIASETGLAVGTVKAHLNQAKTKLQQYFAEPS